jgi:predicted Zn-dependent protease
VFVLALAGCGHGLGATGSSVSLDQEWQLGNQMAAQVAQQVHFVNDPVANNYVRAVGERIHAQTPLADRPFDFHIVDDPEINAFSIPGGHVYVNRGLIGAANKADELAAVLAHEESHIVARHVIKQAEQQQTIGAIGSILLGQNPGVLQQLVAQVLAGGAMARFSRSDEKEADDLGLQYMRAAGYNPQGMVDMFVTLQAQDRSNPNAVSRFFLDHPLTQDRINDVQSRIGNMASSSGLITDEPEFHEAKARLGF